MFCTKCGNNLLEGSKFCTSCGKGTEIQDGIEASPKKKSAWKKLLSGIIGALAFLAAYGVARYATQESFSSSSNGDSESVERMLIEASIETNKQLPMMVDSVTQLSTTAAIGKDFVYLYRLIGEDYLAVTQEDLNDSLRGDIVNGACTTPETRPMLDEGVRLIYRYSNEQGTYLGEIPIVLADCK